MSSPMAITIEVKAKELGKDLFLHEKIGDVEYRGHEAALHRSVPNSDLVLHISGKRYMIQVTDICKLLMDKILDSADKNVAKQIAE
jgi:hypothetical protein